MSSKDCQKILKPNFVSRKMESEDFSSFQCEHSQEEKPESILEGLTVLQNAQKLLGRAREPLAAQFRQ